MGCDIHCFIEYRKAGSAIWRDFGGRINPGRNYLMFGALAGVRVDDVPHVSPRGCCPDMAYAAFEQCSIMVSPTLTEGWKNQDGEVVYSRAYAEEAVAKGYCQWLPRGEKDGVPNFVTCSDGHTHSWLNAAEFELALAVYLKFSGFEVGMQALPAPTATLSTDLAVVSGKTEDDAKWALDAITEYWAILHAMRCFEAQGHESRLVFWFDN